MTFQPANYFYNIVNQNGTQAADPTRLHRVGAAFYNGSVLLSTPRQNALDQFFALEIEGNPVDTAVNGNLVWPTLIPGGVTYPLSTEVDGRILSSIEALNLDAPFVIWAETPYLTGAGGVTETSFSYFIPTFDTTNILAPPGPNAVQALTFENQPTNTVLLDFTTASALGQIYLFWAEQSQPTTISWSSFDGSNASQAQELLTISEAESIVSMDAAAVQFLDSTGAQVTQLAIVVLAEIAGGPQFFGWLMDPSSASVATLQMPSVPPMPDCPNSCIRAAWGTIARTDDPQQTVLSGLVLLCVPSLDDPDFNNSSPEGQAVGYGASLMTVLALPQGGVIPDWQDMRPPASNWPMASGVPAVQAATSAPMTTLFPIPIPNESVGNCVTYYVGLATSSGVVQVEAETFVVLGAYFYVQFYLAFQLTLPGQVSPPQSTYDPSFTGADVAAAISSWTLVGMIAGLPPYFSDQPAGTVMLTHTLASSGSTVANFSMEKTVTVSGECLPLTGSFQQAITNSNSNQSSFNMLSPTSINNQILPPGQGVALYWQPEYQHATFTMANAVNTSTNLTFTMLWAGGAGGIFPVFFSLQDLNTPVANDPVTMAFCSFPTADDGISTVRWPASNDPTQWVNQPPESWQVKTLLDVAFFTVTHSTEINGQALTFGTSEATQMDNVVTINLTMQPPKILSILGLTLGGPLTLNSSIQSTFGISQTFSFSYGSLPASADQFESMVVQPLLLQPNGNNAPWIPALNATQTPWLLTWQVTLLSQEASSRMPEV